MNRLRGLARLPARIARGYMRVLREMRARRAAGLCAMCAAPALDDGLCAECLLERMSAP